MQWLAVAIGGVLGALSRYGLIHLFPHVSGQFPWSTFSANVIGSVLIGFCYVLIIDKGIVPSHWRPFLVIGFLGAFTTFSTFALDAYLIWNEGDIRISIFYVLSSIVACLSVVIGSIYLAQKIL